MALLPLALLQSGCGSSEDGDPVASAGPVIHSKAFASSLEAHQNGLTYDVINLSTWTNRLRRMIEAGNRRNAVDSYLHARGWLGQIEPVLAAMPAISHPLLDADAGEGFHRIEQGLRDGRLRELRPVMKGFHRKMEALRVGVEHAGLRPEQLPVLAVGSLRSLELDAPHGGAFSGLPAIKAAANLEGVAALSLALAPALKRDPPLEGEIEKTLLGVFRTLQGMEGRSGDPRRSESNAPATRFPEYERNPAWWARTLDGQVGRLAGLIAEVSPQG